MSFLHFIPHSYLAFCGLLIYAPLYACMHVEKYVVRQIGRSTKHGYETATAGVKQERKHIRERMYSKI